MIDIFEQSPTLPTLAEYCTIPISFQVKSYYVASSKVGRYSNWDLQEVALEGPYIKDYDTINDPRSWTMQFDLSNWVMLSAFENSKRVGGAMIAWNTPGVDILEGRSDLAVLWDIRVHPEFRGKHIGSLLFERSVQWARDRECKEMKIETQNINVPACKFYGKMGCELRDVLEGMYPTLPNEIAFIWYKRL